MRLTIRSLTATILVLAGATPLAAQKDNAEPDRPHLDAGQDTNSAMAYYMYGLARLQRRPSDAARAFYWATRLTPQWAAPYYGRRIALLLSRHDDLAAYLLRRPWIVERADFQKIDSLEYQARIRDPFVARSLDRMLVDEVIYQLGGGEAAILYGQRTGDPSYDAWKAYSIGQYGRAVQYYAEAIKHSPKEPLLHAARARAFYAMQAYDSAASELTTVLAQLREEDSKRLVYVFDSKAMYEYSIGVVHVARGDVAAARAAFGRALEQDLSFYMAHAALGDVAMRAGDTTTALGEYQLAVQLKGDDAALHFGYGMALLQARHATDAADQFQKATENDPYFALPYFYLARLYDVSEMSGEARDYYQRFLARAPRLMNERTVAQQRLTALAAVPSSGKIPEH
jgi:tetratricopeptide (TPR) repeat protein